MGETFYTILGVEQDADSGAIRRAYRRQVKECHPDVNDDPDASDRFKRLTAARDVLLDADERSAYDRLGHDAYIRQYVESSVWSPASGDTTGSTSPESPTRAAWGRSASRAESAGKTGWNSPGESTTQSGSSAHGSRSRSTVDGNTAAGTDRTRNRRRTQRPRWSRGHRAERTGRRRPYRRADSSADVSSPLKSALGTVRRLGPWLVIHLTLVVSALATTWFMLNRPGTDPALAAATGVFSLLLVGVVLLLSLVHLITELS